MIIVLIAWAIFGLFLGGRLTEMGVIHGNMEFFKGMILTFICGPIYWAAWLFGMIKGIICALANIIAYFNDK